MDILNSMNRVILPGQRVPRVDGWEGLKRFSMPRDSEGIFLNTDPTDDHVFMKAVDINGNETCERYALTRDPVEEFDPKKYVTKADLDNWKEEILNAINSKRSGVAEGSASSAATESVSDASPDPDAGVFRKSGATAGSGRSSGK